MSEHSYIRYHVCVVTCGQLECVHPGALLFYAQAMEVWRVVTERRGIVLEEQVYDAWEDANAQSIHECQTERVLVQDERGTYWHCPACDGEPTGKVVGP